MGVFRSVCKKLGPYVFILEDIITKFVEYQKYLFLSTEKCYLKENLLLNITIKIILAKKVLREDRKLWKCSVNLNISTVKNRTILRQFTKHFLEDCFSVVQQLLS